MFFGEAPKFDDILTVVKGFQEAFKAVADETAA